MDSGGISSSIMGGGWDDVSFWTTRHAAGMGTAFIALLAVAVILVIWMVVKYKKEGMTVGQACNIAPDPMAEAEARALFQAGGLRFGSAACGSTAADMIEHSANTNSAIKHRAEQKLRSMSGQDPQPVLVPHSSAAASLIAQTGNPKNLRMQNMPVHRASAHPYLSEDHVKSLLGETGTKV
jgi:hypothetical protein